MHTHVRRLHHPSGSCAFPALALASLMLSCSSSERPKTPPPPPTITFEAPQDGYYVHGAVPIRATASGVAAIKALRFSAPAALATAPASYDTTANSGSIDTTLDVSALPDGPVRVTATAEDSLGGISSASITLNVAQRAPIIQVLSPAANTTVKGVVGVTASATAQTGATVTSLELVNPPGGMGADASPGPDGFSTTWDTAAAPDGSTTLHFRAIDSTGLPADVSVVVTVDNVPQGKIDAYVSAGAPIRDAFVEVWALSDTTGDVDTTVGASGLLGSGGPTDASGRILVTIATENYSGPIQLRAKPAAGTTLQYVDPADPSNGFVQVPSTLPLTSILASYGAGTSISAPITLTTTLADAELLAYARGLHRSHPTTHTVTEAAAYGDGLFTQHVQVSTPRWALRSTVPVDLTTGATTLTDRAYAALTDVALNQLGKDLGAQVHVSGVITAPFLTAKLLADIAADGQFDGAGSGGAAITTETGSPPYTFDANTLRIRLANGLDTWVQSPRNLSTLNRSTLAGASIYNQMSGDTSELFGAQATEPFDNGAPGVAVVVTYGASDAAPYAGSFVAGNTRIVITATDPSGVQTVSARLGTQLLDSAASTNSTGDGQTLTYAVTVDTRTLADMSYTLSVTTTDHRNNTATVTPATLTTDNTAPVISPTAPSAAAHYSATIPLDASATDGTGAGVASLVETAESAVDQDAAITRFYGSWAIASASGDGPTAFIYRACDLVGNCADSAIQAAIDRTPPTIAAHGTVPGFVTAPTVTIQVTASDGGAGVSSVRAQVPGQIAVTGTLSGGIWTLADVPLAVGSNSVQIWGLDLATPQNGSSSSGSVVTVQRVTTPPVPMLTAARSYVDERGIALASAAVPPVYTLASTTRVALSANPDVYKVSSRLSSPGLTAAVLETNNPDNIPYLQIQVPLGYGTAALQSATYSVTVAGVVHTGDLMRWRSPTATATLDVFDLPFTSDLFPELATTAGAISVVADATFVDQAGQSGSLGSVPLTFHVLGPPLYVSEDTNYPTYIDGRGTFVYRLGNDPGSGSAYSALFDPANAALQGQVRLVRYLVRNPAAIPVATSAPLSGASWTMSEQWARFRGAERSGNWGTNIGPGAGFTADGFTLRDATYWLNPSCPTSGTSGCWSQPNYSETGPTFPCSGGFTDTSGNSTLAHHLGDTGNKYICVNENAALSPEQVTSTLQATFFSGVSPTGGEGTPAPTVGGLAVVPAATGSTAGELVLYVYRPVTASRPTPLAWSALTSGSRYEAQTDWLFVYKRSYYSGSQGGSYSAHIYEPTVGAKSLRTATESVAGSLQLVSSAVHASTLAGESNGAAAPAQSFTRTLASH